tara:strand:+ start:383 stop:568 length:186 start_codon:yes stop_codon:yes gene_type:complete
MKKLDKYFELYKSLGINKLAAENNISEEDISDMNDYFFRGEITNPNHNHQTLSKLLDKIVK